MRSVFVIHWKSEEAGPLLDACRAAGFAVDSTEGDGMAVMRAVRRALPDVFAIDLSRRPSHSKEAAVWLRGSKRTREIPIVFVGGAEKKVAPIRGLIPDADYCDLSGLAAALKTAVKRAANPASRRDPVTPPGMMERAQYKSAAEKLGIAAGCSVRVVDAPRGFPELLGVLPEKVEFGEDPAPVTLWFVHDRGTLLASLRRMRSAARQTKLWLIWRKAAAPTLTQNAVTQNDVRNLTREVGLVDYKICSVDVHWSGMLFALKKA